MRERVILAADLRIRRDGKFLEMATPWTGPLRDLVSRSGVYIVCRGLPPSNAGRFAVESAAELRSVGEWLGMPPVGGILRALRAARVRVRGPVVCHGDIIGLLVAVARPSARGPILLFWRGQQAPSITFHGRYPHSVLRMVELTYARVLRRAARRSAVIVTVSQDLANSLGSSPVFVAPEVDWGGLEGATRQVVPRQQDRALFVGRLELEKGPELAIRAAAAAQEIRRITLVGHGSLRDHLEDVAQEVSADVEVDFVPALEFAEILELGQRVRVLLAPSLSEGFGLAPFEALTMGAAVVVSDVGGLPEAVGWSDRAHLMSSRVPGIWGETIDRSSAGRVASASEIAEIRRARNWYTLAQVLDAVMLESVQPDPCLWRSNPDTVAAGGQQ